MTLSVNKIKSYTAYYEMYDNMNDWNYLGQHQVSFENTDILMSPSVVGMANVTFRPFATSSGSCNSIYLSVNGKYVGKQYYDNTSSSDREIPAYFVADLSAGYEVPVKKSSSLTFSFHVQNLFNNMYYADAWLWRAYFQQENAFYAETGIYPQVNFETDKPITDKIIKFELGSYSLFDTKLKELQNALITSSNAKAMSIFYDIIDNLGGKSKKGNRILTASINYMLEHFDDATLSNEILARQSGISEIYFRRLFKEMFDTTPKQYILGLRTKKACKLLVESSASVGEIAEECGFSSVYHFCRSFKEYTGLTPGEYAKKNSILGNITI